MTLLGAVEEDRPVWERRPSEGGGTARNVLVTGGAGFLGSYLVRLLLDQGDRVIDVDCETYAADPTRFKGRGERYSRVLRPSVQHLHPDTVRGYGAYAVLFHLAAETHVDVSLGAPIEAIETNVTGTARALEVARTLEIPRIVVMSTDEVTGDIGFDGAPTDDRSPIRASSPYSASKAGAELLAHAWRRSFGLDVRVVRSANLYGPGQHPEKFIPRCITKMLAGEAAPLFGDGRQVRDWIYVRDTARAVLRAAEIEVPATAEPVIFCVGARCERTNREVVEEIHRLTGLRWESVPDRPGHDQRYACDPTRAEAALGWRAEVPWDTGLAETIAFYVKNPKWTERMIARGGRWA